MYQLFQCELRLCWSKACMGLMQPAQQLWHHKGCESSTEDRWGLHLRSSFLSLLQPTQQLRLRSKEWISSTAER